MKKTNLPSPTLYWKLVGSLIHLIITYPSTSFAIHIANKIMNASHHLHLIAIHRIICYLTGTSHCGPFLRHGTSLELTIYNDADWALCPDSR